ncbi:hypothetical protein OnM2_073015 [Erysiphe neolycopersici]|uniref:Uncharacterized protein n=1 Tax=Erysiphe neolycopersici TaxID=212602 RepID=A0A420HJ91_9PEZI|nr:hypothetical protein OnM2_073015 [Erysiphe neolycopersici]
MSSGLIKIPSQNSYVKERVFDIECMHRSRRPFEDYQSIARINHIRSSPTTSISILPSRKINLKYSNYSPSLESEQSDYTETAPYTILSSSPEESSEGLSNSLSSEFSQASGHYVIKTATGQKKRLYLDTDTPLDISKFQYYNRESFNTGVMNLVQQEPDKPIGGNRTLPSTLPYLSMTSASHLKPPKIEVHTPSGPSRTSLESSKPVSRSQPKFHDPFRDKYSIKTNAAPGTLSYGKEFHMNEKSSKLLLGEAKSINKGSTSTSSPLQGRFDKPDTITNSQTKVSPETNDESSSKFNEGSTPVPMPALEKFPLSNSNVPLTSISEVDTDIVPIQETTAPLESALQVDEISLPNPSQVLAVATPELSTYKKGKNTLRQGYRMTRRVLMRKGVLKILVGRKLAGPAKDLIKKSSEGVDILEDALVL